MTWMPDETGCLPYDHKSQLVQPSDEQYTLKEAGASSHLALLSNPILIRLQFYDNANERMGTFLTHGAGSYV